MRNLLFVTKENHVRFVVMVQKNSNIWDRDKK